MVENQVEKHDSSKEYIISLSEARELIDIVYLINMLIQNRGNLSRSAEELGIGRRTLYDLMEKYGISCSNGKLSINLTPLLYHIELNVPCLESHLISQES